MFNPSNNQLIAYDIDSFNKALMAENKPYILIGPGRWGSSDTWLGIPVKWPNIAGAHVIVEAGETNYHIDPSQGTHFFQNLTSCGAVYLTVQNNNKQECFDMAYLEAQPTVKETKYIRQVHFDSALITKVDGKKNRGIIMKNSFVVIYTLTFKKYQYEKQRIVDYYCRRCGYRSWIFPLTME